MTSRERVLLTLNHQAVDRAPRELWALPGITMFHMDEYQQVVNQYQSLPLDETTLPNAL